MSNLNEMRKWYEPLFNRKILDSDDWKHNFRSLVNTDLLNDSKKLFFNPVLYEIVSGLKYREGMFILINEDNSNSFGNRGLKMYSIKYLLYNMDFWGFFRQRTNLYAGVSKLDNPMTVSYKHDEYKKSLDIFSDNYHKWVMDVDLLLDFDAHNKKVKKLRDETFELTELLDKFNISYSIRFSGRGFHIYIDGSEFSMYDKFEKPKLYHDLSLYLNNLMGFVDLDLGLYESEEKISRRVCKVPFSFDCKSENVCLPLTKKELFDFKEDYAKPEFILKNRKIYKHGIPIENKDKESKIKEFIEHISPD